MRPIEPGGVIAELSESQLRLLTELDHRDHEALIAGAVEPATPPSGLRAHEG